MHCANSAKLNKIGVFNSRHFDLSQQEDDMCFRLYVNHCSVIFKSPVKS